MNSTIVLDIHIQPTNSEQSGITELVLNGSHIGQTNHLTVINIQLITKEAGYIALAIIACFLFFPSGSINIFLSA